jgi:hypothetical protein
MPDVSIFISYSHADVAHVRNLRDRLRGAGLKPWLDEDDILPGAKWLDAIKTAIRQSDFFLLCLSPNSISRRGVLQKEVRTALDMQNEKLESDVYLIPAWIAVGAPFPKEELNELPDSLKERQWVHLGEPVGWDKLIRSFKSQLAKLGKDGLAIHAAKSQGMTLQLATALEPTVAAFKNAIRTCDRHAAEESYARLESLLESTDGALSSNAPRLLLSQLAQQRWFDLLGRVADAVI